MSQALSDYFVVEARDYLGQMGRLLTENASPDPERLFRLARAARGSAELAQADKIALLAGALANAARALLEGRTVWSSDFRERALRTVHDLDALVRSSREWGSAQEARLQGAMRRWETRPGISPAVPVPDAPAASAAGEIVPIEALFFDDAGPHILDVPQEVQDVVPIEALLFRGEDALREAISLREEIDALLPDPGASKAAAVLRARMNELFQLLHLALPDDEADRVG
jgi:chemotaxis protein histidine kinase CheA